MLVVGSDPGVLLDRFASYTPPASRGRFRSHRVEFIAQPWCDAHQGDRERSSGLAPARQSETGQAQTQEAKGGRFGGLLL